MGEARREEVVERRAGRIQETSGEYKRYKIDSSCTT